MIACIAGCLVIWALVPRQGPTPRATVDAKSVAQNVKSTKKWDVALAPGVGEPWRPVTATQMPGDQSHAPRWQVGYKGNGQDYIAIAQTPNGGDAWVKQVANGTEKGNVTVSGVSWKKVELSRAGGKALVRSGKLGGLDTVITGQGSWEQLQKFAAQAKPLSQLK